MPDYYTRTKGLLQEAHVQFTWSVFIDLGIISVALFIATGIRAAIPFFQRFLIPNALTAGFILLPLYNFVFPSLGLSTSGLEELAYHLLSISFVAMTLRKSQPRTGPRDGRIFATAVGVISQYGIQALVGLLVTFLLISTVMPDLFPAFGMLLPLGFALGPGQAFAIGEGWVDAGFTGAGTIGLTFAAIGFIWSSFGGIFLINYAIRRGWLPKNTSELLNKRRIRKGIVPRGTEAPIGARLTTESEAIDSMTLNTAVVLISYFGAFLLLNLFSWLLSFAGPMGVQLAETLWGISFIFAALVAMLVKTLLRAFKIDHITDSASLTRIAGLSVDVMVAAAIGAISLVIVGQFWLPIAIMSVLGMVVSILGVPWLCSRIFKDHPFHRALLVFGVSTGTLSSGLALLRVLDPDFETPVASDYTYAAGLVFVLVIPFILAINLPTMSVSQNNPFLFWLAVLVALAYTVFVLISFLVIARRRAFSRPTQVWLQAGEDDDKAMHA